MDKQLKPETQKEIRALCESIAQQEQLGADVNEELRGHIEDKVIAYLDGREAVTEEDAFFLASKHFGDAAVIKSLLHDANPRRASSSLGRRIAVVMLATLAAQIVERCAEAIFTIVEVPYGMVFVVTGAMRSLGIPLLVYIALRNTRNKNATGWIAQLTTGPLALFRVATILVFALRYMLPDAIPIFRPQVQAGPIALLLVQAFSIAYSVTGPVALCLVWIWWCDQAPRTLANIRAAASVWILFKGLTTLILFFSPSAYLALGAGGKFHARETTPGVLQLKTMFMSNLALGLLVFPILVALLTAYGYARVRRRALSEVRYDA